MNVNGCRINKSLKFLIDLGHGGSCYGFEMGSQHGGHHLSLAGRGFVLAASLITNCDQGVEIEKQLNNTSSVISCKSDTCSHVLLTQKIYANVYDHVPIFLDVIN